MVDFAKAASVGSRYQFVLPVAQSAAKSGVIVPHSVEQNRRAGRTSDARVQKAVYAHIQAIRALGRTRVNTFEIAKALGLKVGLVDQVVHALKTKGVKIAE